MLQNLNGNRGGISDNTNIDESLHIKKPQKKPQKKPLKL